VSLKTPLDCAPSETSNETPDMTHPVWNDPLGFDPILHGPPYLRVNKQHPTGMYPKVASLPRALNMGALGSLVAFLRALALVHQGHHWLTQGAHFYADHLLFDRLYEGAVKHVDPLAERAVGEGAGASLSPFLQANLVARYLGFFYGTHPINPTPDQMVMASLDGEDAFLAHLRECRTLLPNLSSGTGNLLDETADLHESHVYLLRQRAPSVLK